MGKTSIVRAALALALLAAAPARAAEPLVPVAAGFQDETVLEGLQSPTAVRVAPPPDGRIFVARKDGAVMLYDGVEDPDPQLAVDLREETLDYLDRGMLGMALDPQFATRPYLYLLYTRDARIGEEPPVWNDVCPGLADAGCPASARLVRVRIDELGVAGPIEPVIEDEWCQQYLSHSIGTVLFGPDGMLYAGAGDAAHFGRADWGQLPDSGPAPPNPCGDPPLEGGSIRSQDLRTAGDPVGLDGAIVRVDPVTGLGAPGNPFAASADPNARRIIAYGLRNPFRFAFRPGTNELWIGEVGRAIWEEIDRIPDTTDATAENFGWPCFEGPTTAATFANVPVCVGLPASDVDAAGAGLSALRGLRPRRGRLRPARRRVRGGRRVLALRLPSRLRRRGVLRRLRGGLRVRGARRRRRRPRPRHAGAVRPPRGGRRRAGRPAGGGRRQPLLHAVRLARPGARLAAPHRLPARQPGAGGAGVGGAGGGAAPAAGRALGRRLGRP